MLRTTFQGTNIVKLGYYYHSCKGAMADQFSHNPAMLPTTLQGTNTVKLGYYYHSYNGYTTKTLNRIYSRIYRPPNY